MKGFSFYQFLQQCCIKRGKIILDSVMSLIFVSLPFIYCCLFIFSDCALIHSEASMRTEHISALKWCRVLGWIYSDPIKTVNSPPLGAFF